MSENDESEKNTRWKVMTSDGRTVIVEAARLGWVKDAALFYRYNLPDLVRIVIGGPDQSDDLIAAFTSPRSVVEDPMPMGAAFMALPNDDRFHIPSETRERVERLRRIIHRYGDRHAMATCPRPDWQREIDDAMSWVAGNDEVEIPEFPGESP